MNRKVTGSAGTKPDRFGLCAIWRKSGLPSPLVQSKSISPAIATGSSLALQAVFSLLLLSAPSWAATGGTIAGVVADQSGAVIPGATLKLISIAQTTTYQTVSDRQGLYTFPNLLVGRYDLTVEANGFASRGR